MRLMILAFHGFSILWNAALEGDLQAIKLIMDRVDGTPRQSIETNVREFETIKVMEIVEDNGLDISACK